MPTHNPTCRCPQCGYAGALRWDSPRTGQHTTHCRACGHDGGRLFLDALLREPHIARLRLASVEPPDRDGRSLATFARAGYGIFTMLDTAGGGFWHAFEHPPTDETIARFRRAVETNPNLDAGACYLTRWNGHALEVRYGTVPPTQDKILLAMERAAGGPRRQR